MKQTSSPKIAGVVLCLNEAGNLPRALGSLAWCDEVLVLDSGSTDGSQEIAMRCGARVIEHRQQGRFLITEQRNWALNQGQLKSEWVLFLDADEEISSVCRQAIQHAIQHPAAADGYELTPRYWFLGRWLKFTQGYPNWHPRLLKPSVLHFEGGVWESFAGSSQIGKINEPYEHYAFSKGIDDWVEKHLRYAKWEADAMYNYKASKDSSGLTTSRSFRKRALMSRLWPIRPLLRFTEKYFLNGGWLEGYQGLVFSALMGFYELLIVIKFIEARNAKRGESL